MFRTVLGNLRHFLDNFMDLFRTCVGLVLDNVWTGFGQHSGAFLDMSEKVWAPLGPVGNFPGQCLGALRRVLDISGHFGHFGHDGHFGQFLDNFGDISGHFWGLF